ncbi:hypothetical protein HDR58_07795, partial [bacterium]|nr:hypothetical protein [bacterium]
MLIDPKMLEFSEYVELYDQYLVHIEGVTEGVITDINDSAQAVNTLVAEMDRRYRLFRLAGCRNISEYNSKIENEKLQYLVGIIDEYADLKMTLGESIESPVIRLAQMSRAVGIHLIVATQRPSKYVITDVMKANFPHRIAFKTFMKIDSKAMINCEDAK